jgi:hypothetical protein
MADELPMANAMPVGVVCLTQRLPSQLLGKTNPAWWAGLTCSQSGWWCAERSMRYMNRGARSCCVSAGVNLMRRWISA